jgi:hypothetical protein
LILLDPSPFPYVYGWALLPTLAGLSFADRFKRLDGRFIVAAVGFAGAASMAALTLPYPLLKGRQAPTGSNFRVLLDRPLSSSDISKQSTEALVALMISGRFQQSLGNQLAIRQAICKRVQGTVLAVWQNHPICLPDASYYWYELKWPNILAGGEPPQPAPWFEAIFENCPPEIMIWSVPGGASELNPWAKNLLRGYVLYDGFAVRRITAGKDSYGTESSRLSNGCSSAKHRGPLPNRT